MITKEEIQKILEKKGDVRGVVFETDANYILKKEGQEGIGKLEQQLKQWGVSLKYQEVKAMRWYPVAWRVLSLLAAKETLAWGDEEIRKMGENAPHVSIVLKLLFKLFASVKKFAEQVPNYWRKHYSSGNLEVMKMDESSKEMLLCLKDFAFHPVLCKYYEGYFEKTLQITMSKDSKVRVKETKCVFRDDTSYCEYLFTWT